MMHLPLCIYIYQNLSIIYTKTSATNLDTFISGIALAGAINSVLGDSDH